MDGVDPVHCTKGTCNFSELVGVKVWGVSEKLPCVTAIVNNLLMIKEVILKFSESWGRPIFMGRVLRPPQY